MVLKVKELRFTKLKKGQSGRSASLEVEVGSQSDQLK